jgi:probable phosphoglycerate mutase
LLRIILVRHGETDWNQEGRVQGSGSDRELTETGKQQAESIGLKLRQERIQAIYSSPLRRALDTAQVIARHHQVEVQIEPSLNEIYAGELEGIPIKKLGSYLSELVAREQGDESVSKLYGGERLAAVQQRAWSTIQRLADKHSDGAIVVVSHYFVILSIICSMLNMPPSEMGRLKLDVGSISTIVFSERGIRLALFNDSCHLAEG